jgi:hypothetical protein
MKEIIEKVVVPARIIQETEQIKKWYVCDFAGCDYKSSEKSATLKHALVHLEIKRCSINNSEFIHFNTEDNLTNWLLVQGYQYSKDYTWGGSGWYLIANEEDMDGEFIQYCLRDIESVKKEWEERLARDIIELAKLQSLLKNGELIEL